MSGPKAWFRSAFHLEKSAEPVEWSMYSWSFVETLGFRFGAVPAHVPAVAEHPQYMLVEPVQSWNRRTQTHFVIGLLHTYLPNYAVCE